MSMDDNNEEDIFQHVMRQASGATVFFHSFIEACNSSLEVIISLFNLIIVICNFFVTD